MSGARIVESIDDLKAGQVVAWSPENYEHWNGVNDILGTVEDGGEGLKIRYAEPYGGGFDWIEDFINDGTWVILRDVSGPDYEAIKVAAVALIEAISEMDDCGADCDWPMDHIEAIRSVVVELLEPLQAVAA